MCHDCNYTGYRKEELRDGTCMHDYCDCSAGDELRELVCNHEDFEYFSKAEGWIKTFDALTPGQCAMIGIFLAALIAIVVAILA